MGSRPLDGLGVGPPCGEFTHLMDLGWGLPVGWGGVHPLDGLGVGPPVGVGGGRERSPT